MAEIPTPRTVLIEFLYNLQATITDREESLVPVLRGSLLLKHWFGDVARRPADIDLECFERSTEPIPPERTTFRDGGFGGWGEFETLVDFGKAMCRYAAEGSESPESEVQFRETQAPADGASLWTYGTPGERYYAGWIWPLKTSLMTGNLQIDIAQPGTYHLDDIEVEDVEMKSRAGHAFTFPAYTREMMLAAKLSWLLRSLTFPGEARNLEVGLWNGEPKDLYDAHLLLTQADLDPGTFGKSLVAVALEDDLDWNHLAVLPELGSVEITYNALSSWNEFRREHLALVTAEPAQLLREIANRIVPLLSEFVRPGEEGFLQEIHADPVDELAYLVYADWLEERGDPRCEFLRGFSKLYFRGDKLSVADRAAAGDDFCATFRATSRPWLLRLFETPERFQEMRKRIEDGTL